MTYTDSEAALARILCFCPEFLAVTPVDTLMHLSRTCHSIAEALPFHFRADHSFSYVHAQLRKSFLSTTEQDIVCHILKSLDLFCIRQQVVDEAWLDICLRHQWFSIVEAFAPLRISPKDIDTCAKVIMEAEQWHLVRILTLSENPFPPYAHALLSYFQHYLSQGQYSKARAMKTVLSKLPLTVLTDLFSMVSQRLPFPHNNDLLYQDLVPYLKWLDQDTILRSDMDEMLNVLLLALPDTDQTMAFRADAADSLLRVLTPLNLPESDVRRIRSIQLKEMPQLLNQDSSDIYSPFITAFMSFLYFDPPESDIMQVFDHVLNQRGLCYAATAAHMLEYFSVSHIDEMRIFSQLAHRIDLDLDDELAHVIDRTPKVIEANDRELLLALLKWKILESSVDRPDPSTKDDIWSVIQLTRTSIDFIVGIHVVKKLWKWVEECMEEEEQEDLLMTLLSTYQRQVPVRMSSSMHRNACDFYTFYQYARNALDVLA
jgi:hypothetical protein